LNVDEFNTEVTEQSLWKMMENKVKLFRFLYYLFSCIMALGFGVLYLIMYSKGLDSIAFYSTLGSVIIILIITQIIAFTHNHYESNFSIINRIKRGLIIEQLIMIANRTFVTVKPISKVQRKLAIAALAELGAKEAIKYLEEIITTDQLDMKKISSKAIQEIELRNELNNNIASYESYRDKQGEYISLYEIEKKETKIMLIITAVPIIAISLVISITGIIFAILQGKFDYFTILFIVLGVIIVIEIIIINLVMLRRNKKLALHFETGEIDQLIETANKGKGMMFAYAPVVSAIAMLGDSGDERAIPVLTFLLTASQRRIRQKASVAMDMIYAKNINAMRKLVIF